MKLQENAIELVTINPLLIYRAHLGNSDKLNSLFYKMRDGIVYENDVCTSDVDNNSYFHNNKTISLFLGTLKAHLTTYISTIGYNADLFDFYIQKSWFVDFSASQNPTIAKHIHHMSDISFVYYINTNEATKLCFEHTESPNELYSGSFLQTEAFLQRNMYSFNYSYIVPAIGDLVLFPSKTTHWVEKDEQYAKDRFCYSGDVVMILKEGKKSYEFVRNPLKTWKRM